ncbi:MAG: NAD(P)-dependent oxidoreductase [Anaerolineae bacterium]|nr:NAD(P)-dependent oxidoreductase [Anaerolineae bacterium]
MSNPMYSFSDDCSPLSDRERVNLPYYGVDVRPAHERIYDFDEILLPFDEQRARFEAARCIHCPTPAACVTACPVHNDIPTIMCLIEKGNFLEASQTFRLTSTIPEICGRVCPQEKLCQGSCVHNLRNEPVLIGPLEVFVTDYERSVKGSITIRKGAPSGRKVAIVGGGPSGLACAERLINFGHDVTVYDQRPIPGGLLMYGIPGFKLSSKVLMAKLNELQNAGIHFVTNTFIGKDITIDALFNDGFDAVYISVGAGVDAQLNIPGEDLPGVFKGTEFLIRSNVNLDLLPPGMTTRPKIGKRVAVIGGGDTASDCERTSIRLGAQEVFCIYRRTEDEMPGVSKDRTFARQEGTRYLFLTQPIRFIADGNGKLTAMECVRMELGEKDAKGRRSPVPIPDSNFILEIDTAITAVGYYPFPSIGETGLDVTRNGLIAIDSKTGATSRRGIYAGGDAVRGPSLVVEATADGIRAASSIHEYLTKL